MASIKDMTEGKPVRLMIRFSIPLLLTNALQMMFTIVDSAIIGRMIGVDAFAAVGATASLHWLILSFVLGLSQGFGTLIAQRFGARDFDGLRRAFVTASYMAVSFGIVIGVGGVLTSEAFMVMLYTPPELVGDAVIYLSWLFGALPITCAHNLVGMTLYSLGDSKTPFRAMIVATFVNIAFDFLLVLPFGVAGVAAASVIAQTIGLVYCLAVLSKSGVFGYRGHRGHRGTVLLCSPANTTEPSPCVPCVTSAPAYSFRWDRPSVWPLLRLGLPLGFRNAVIEVGGLLVQRYINGYGTEFVAGIAAARRMYSLLVIAGSAIEASIATFVAQNFGAKRLDRVKLGVRDGVRLSLVSAAVMMAVILPFGRAILSLLVDGDPARLAAVLDIGTIQLNMMALFLPFLHFLYLYRAALQGVGNTFIPMLSGFAELFMRVSSVLLLTRIWGEWGVYLSDPLGWPAAAVLLFVSYLVVFRKLGFMLEVES